MCRQDVQEGETIKGVVYVNSKDELSHNRLSLTVDGTGKLQLSARSVGRFGAFYNSLKPIHVGARRSYEDTQRGD